MSTAKKKALIISCIAVVLCAAVIAGATYALFTDGEQYAIGVNTGKIDVSAALSMEDAWSESQAADRLDGGGNGRKQRPRGAGQADL